MQNEHTWRLEGDVTRCVHCREYLGLWDGKKPCIKKLDKKTSLQHNTNMSKNTKVTRKGSGRTKGSYSFVRIPLADLVAKFADQTTPIVVGRKFAEEVGFKGLVANPANATLNAIAGTNPASAVTAKVTNLDE